MKGLPWFYLRERVPPGTRVALEPGDASHATRALRLRAGSELTVSDGAGWVAPARLVEAGRREAAVEVGEGSMAEPRGPEVRVAFAAPAGDRAWWAVQKLTEIGVDRIDLVESERSTRRRDVDATLQRAVAVARQAAMQSRRPFLPEVGVAEGGLLARRPEDETSVVLWEGATRPLHACLPEATRGVGLHVGPEGGLGERDLADAEAAGAALASLGEPNLRTETAAIVAAALALNRYGRLG